MDDTIRIVSKTLEKEEDVLALFLFGSRARNENDERSDYDFYVILDRNVKDSLREDDIHRKVAEATKKCKQAVHLTFQYLFIINDDKSLILKISSEGRLIFSKTYLIAPHKQFGLQKYFICRWGINEKKFGGGNKKEFVRNTKLLINRMLYGYIQKYTYNGKLRESKSGGLVDNKTIFGEGRVLTIPDITFDFVKYFIEKNRGEMIILNSCYIPMDSIDGIEKYYGKRELERFIKNKNKADKELFITSVVPHDLDKISIKFENVGEDRKRNTIISINELPSEIKKNIVIKKKHDF